MCLDILHRPAVPVMPNTHECTLLCVWLVAQLNVSFAFTFVQLCITHTHAHGPMRVCPHCVCVCQSSRRAKQTSPPAAGPGSLTQPGPAWQGFNWRLRQAAGGETVCRSNWGGGSRRTGRNKKNEDKMSAGTGLHKSAV